AEKTSGLRLFGDAEGKMNLGLTEVGGALLVVSQFTLYGNSETGKRPSFIDAARPEEAIPLYERFLAALRAKALQVESGEFGAMSECRVVLASASPRRRQLLELIGIEHDIQPANIDESVRPRETPARYA